MQGFSLINSFPLELLAFSWELILYIWSNFDGNIKHYQLQHYCKKDYVFMIIF